MFKKTKIAAATIALLSAAAAQNVSAVAFDESGNKAQVLIFPYYNTNNGFLTGFNIRNTSNDTKAVKVRFRESKLSNDVLDFNVYLSPWDRFSMSVSVNGAGQAAITTPDKTCTFPAIVGSKAFKGNVYKNTSDADAREGYLEVIEMGVINPNTVIAKDTTALKIANGAKIVDGIKHAAATNAPVDCSVIKDAWDAGTFTEGGANAVVNGVNDTTRIAANITTPTGGLQGWSFLLDIANGNAFVANPAAIRNYQTSNGDAQRRTAQHYKSDTPATFLLPSLASGNVITTEVLNDIGNNTAYPNNWATAVDYASTLQGQAEIAYVNSGSTPPTASGINPYPISALLAATGLTNDYLLDATTNVGTDWVITFPMRKHGIYPNVTYSPAATVAAPVFANPVDGNVKFTTTVYNSEEQKVANLTDDFSPVASAPFDLLPREVNILSFGKTGDSTVSKVLNSANTKNLGVSFNDGWAELAFTLNKTANVLSAAAVSSDPINTGITFNGIPAIGFAAIHGNVTTVPGAKTVTIGETVPHAFVRSRPAVN